MPDENSGIVPERGALSLSDADWAEARRRKEVIGPLADLDEVTTTMAINAGEQLGFSKRTVYTLISRYKESGCTLASLAPKISSGGRGGKRLPTDVEKIISSTISDMYLSRQRYRIESVIKEIYLRCHKEKIKQPARNTVRARIQSLSSELTIQARYGRNATHRLKAVVGSFPIVSVPLEVVQIDHTPVDVIVVDSSLRKPIGRPWITIGIDVFSRCITGFCLTLEPPSSVSVGLCLSHSATDKQAWLERLKVKAEWPVHGKPKQIFTDNAKEFYSEALNRGCMAHGIEINYRPVGAPHYGGIIERVIGTFMNMVHTLPGTTFSNVAERGSYDSEHRSSLTLTELECWFALAISGPYHNSLHHGINEPPIARWKRGLLEKGEPKPVLNTKAFLVDFLPVIRRRIQKIGFVIDHIYYFSNAVRPWIAARDQGHRFLIRRDPRDLSRIWVLHPKDKYYLEIPYRTLSNPSITLWEHRQAIKQIKEAGRALVDERTVFGAIAEMREIVNKAVMKSRKARRNKARHEHLKKPSQPELSTQPVKKKIPSTPPKPFHDIEEW